MSLEFEGVPALVLTPGEGMQRRTLDLRNEPTDAPLISCIMATRGAVHPARHAIACFLAQTYAARELVIVCAHADSDVEAFVAKLADPRIVFVRALGVTANGELRNAAIARANGDYLCVWDDDDLSHPDRLTLQWRALVTTGARASFLMRVILWSPQHERIAVSGARIWENTMLVARDAIIPYPPLERGSDTVVAKALKAAHRVTVVDCPLGYCYIEHGLNVRSADHFAMLFANATGLFAESSYKTGIEGLTQNLPITAYLGGLADG